MNRTSTGMCAWKATITTVVGVVGWVSPAIAIPSPELVIGSVSSLGQVFALGAAMLGGGAAFAGRRLSTNPKRGQNSKMLLRLSALFLVMALTSIGVNVWQLNTAKTARLTHLQATLTRPAQFEGTEIKDKNLLEMSFTAQSANPLAITTTKAEALLTAVGAGSAETLFIDIRENAEHMMGTLPQSRHIRFPDLQGAGLDLAGKNVVLFCHNGNRSSETCEKLAAMGIDCRFIAGGIEKWIVEGRPFTDETVRILSDLRAIPDYPNRDVLFDIPSLLQNPKVLV